MRSKSWLNMVNLLNNINRATSKFVAFLSSSKLGIKFMNNDKCFFFIWKQFFSRIFCKYTIYPLKLVESNSPKIRQQQNKNRLQNGYRVQLWNLVLKWNNIEARSIIGIEKHDGVMENLSRNHLPNIKEYL